jgi:tetraacyldisaccharide 4'-kinase
VLLDASISSGINYWRESFWALNRSSILVLTKAHDEIKLESWKKRLPTFNKPTFSVNSQTEGKLKGYKDKLLNAANIKGKSAITFSGIANHASFDSTIKQLGCNIIDSLSFKDHHLYADQDLKTIEEKYIELNPDIILTTEKDIIKLPPSELPIYAVSIRTDLSKELVEHIDNDIRLLD